MKGCLALVVVALTAAGAAAGSVPAPIVQTGFLTPSGNIACNAGHLVGGRRPLLLVCTLFSAESPSRSQKVWALYTSGATSVGYIMGNAATEFQKLAYGRSWRWHGLRCDSAATGLTCRNSSDHGFFLSRESQRVF